MNSMFDTVRAEVLFASALQASQAPPPVQVRAAVTSTLRRFGIKGSRRGSPASWVSTRSRPQPA
jgi:hypothetical protein